MKNTKNLNFNHAFPFQQLNILTEDIDLRDIEPFRVNYINDEDGIRTFIHEKINILFNVILPKLKLTKEDIITHFIAEEVANILPNSESIPLPDLIKSVNSIKEYVDKANSEKMAIQKIRDEFSYLDVDLTDNELKELNKFILTFK